MEALYEKKATKQEWSGSDDDRKTHHVNGFRRFLNENGAGMEIDVCKQTIDIASRMKSGDVRLHVTVTRVCCARWEDHTQSV